MFKITNNKGFGITFENGYRVSVQWGAGNYSGNYDSDVWKGPVPASPTAETAVIHPNGDFVEIDGSDVQGWQTPNQVADLIAKVSSWESP